jgi:hypothetical protein
MSVQVKKYFKSRKAGRINFISGFVSTLGKIVSLMCIAGLLIVTNFPFLNAFEAHIINVTAKISNYPVVLNEFLPNPINNESCLYGPDGEWVELYNTNNERSYDVEGWTLTDYSGNQLVISDCYTNTGDTIVPPLGFLVVYRKTGPNCTSNFSLNNDGDTVNLYTGNPAGAVLIDTYAYSLSDYCELDPTPGDENSDTRSGDCSGKIPENKSYARIPDGVGDWVDPVPTPGAPNRADENENVDDEINVDLDVEGGSVFETDDYNFGVSAADSEDDNFSAVDDIDISSADSEDLGGDIDNTDDLDTVAGNTAANGADDDSENGESEEETINVKKEENVIGEAAAGDNNDDDDSNSNSNSNNNSDIVEDTDEPEVKEKLDDNFAVDLPAEDSADAGIIDNELDEMEMKEKILKDNLAEDLAVDLLDKEDVSAGGVDGELENDVLGSNDLGEKDNVSEKESPDVLDETILDGQQENMENEEETILDDLEVEDQQPADDETKEIKEKIDEENVDVDNADNSQDEDEDNDSGDNGGDSGDSDNDDSWPIENDDSAKIEFSL